MQLTIKILNEQFTIHRFPENDPIPGKVYKSTFYHISRTDDELSIVCDSKIQLDSPRSESDWSCLKLAGPFEFTQTGILSGMLQVLAENEIGILAISTFDTDYVLVKTVNLAKAKNALQIAGHIFQP